MLTAKEVIQRQRVANMEFRKALHDVLDAHFTRQQEWLDHLELRLEKELLTNGHVSIPAESAEGAEEPKPEGGVT